MMKDYEITPPSHICKHGRNIHEDDCGMCDTANVPINSSKLTAADALYADLMQEVNRLMNLDPDADTPEARQLEWLSTVIEKYETTLYPFP